jgi:predicted RNase H-like HicB family nuclease
MTAKAKIYRDRSGLYVGVLANYPDVAAVGYTPDQARRNLAAALADLARSGNPQPAAHAEPVTRQRSVPPPARPTCDYRA